MDATFSKLLSKPLAPDFAPVTRRLNGLGGARQRSVIRVYVEPKKAPGLDELKRPLRRALKLAKGSGSHQYAVLTGQGLKREHAPGPWVEKFRDADDEDFRYMCGVRYRLYITDALRPIGYCCFNISASHWAEFEVELHEVWLNPGYRGYGLGSMLSERVADLAVVSLRELEQRASAANLSQALGLAVTGDVYSTSGEAFVESTAQALIDAVDEYEWSALKLSDVVSAPYW